MLYILIMNCFFQLCAKSVRKKQKRDMISGK
jgi:hypothetical protein